MVHVELTSHEDTWNIEVIVYKKLFYMVTFTFYISKNQQNVDFSRGFPNLTIYKTDQA